MRDPTKGKACKTSVRTEGGSNVSSCGKHFSKSLVAMIVRCKEASDRVQAPVVDSGCGICESAMDVEDEVSCRLCGFQFHGACVLEALKDAAWDTNAQHAVYCSACAVTRWYEVLVVNIAFAGQPKSFTVLRALSDAHCPRQTIPYIKGDPSN